MEELKIKLENKADDQLKKLIISSLVNFNNTKAQREDYKQIIITLRNKNNILFGGLVGYTHWNWLFISHMWIHEELRGKGFGSKLINAAEQEALKKNCHSAHVDTFDFQALDFYKKIGYEIFGELDDYPIGHKRYFLKKKLK